MDQTKGLESLTFDGKMFFCYDLSAFTDRFPMKINISLVTALFGENYSESVNYLMNGLPFKVDYTGKSIYYKCGNPMGAYGS